MSVNEIEKKYRAAIKKGVRADVYKYYEMMSEAFDKISSRFKLVNTKNGVSVRVGSKTAFYASDKVEGMALALGIDNMGFKLL